MTEPKYVNGVYVSRFLEHEGAIIDPIPEELRSNYRYWRAGHLGRLALNLINQRNVLNTDETFRANFFEDHRPAFRFAYSFANKLGLPNRQFSKGDQAVLDRLLGTRDFTSPAIVYALDSRYNAVELPRLPGTNLWDEPLGPGGRFTGLSEGAGRLFLEELTLDKIDEFARAEIQRIFKLDNSS